MSNGFVFTTLENFDAIIPKKNDVNFFSSIGPLLNKRVATSMARMDRLC